MPLRNEDGNLILKNTSVESPLGCSLARDKQDQGNTILAFSEFVERRVEL